METNILWKGLEYYSLEHCLISMIKGSIAIDSIIVGKYENKNYRLAYLLKLDEQWDMQHCVIKWQIGKETKEIELTKEAHKWLLNGEYNPNFDGCVAIDIPLTPLTNSLPINRRRLPVGQEMEIDLVYIDLFEKQIRRVKQHYKRLSNSYYNYHNIPNDFEARIEVDDEGFVKDYPRLFTRK